jgi:hypothetical protein
MKNKVHHYDILEEMIRARDREHLIQATEIERRMQGLNGEGDRIQEILKETIPREVFDRTIDTLRTRIQAVETAIIKQEGRHQLLQYIPWALTAISLIFMYLMYKK